MGSSSSGKGAGREVDGGGGGGDRGGGEVVLVNLIDKKKDQGRLGLAFERIHALVTPTLSSSSSSSSSPSSPVHLTWFDFHAECKRMR